MKPILQTIKWFAAVLLGLHVLGQLLSVYDWFASERVVGEVMEDARLEYGQTSRTRFSIHRGQSIEQYYIDVVVAYEYRGAKAHTSNVYSTVRSGEFKSFMERRAAELKRGARVYVYVTPNGVATLSVFGGVKTSVLWIGLCGFVFLLISYVERRFVRNDE